MAERRSNTRMRSLLKGRIAFNHGKSTLDCVIRNISDTGARLAVTESVALPDEFELYIPQKEETRQARLRWRRPDEIGVMFKDAAKGEDALDPAVLLRRLLALEAENAALRRQLDAAGQTSAGEPSPHTVSG